MIQRCSDGSATPHSPYVQPTPETIQLDVTDKTKAILVLSFMVGTLILIGVMVRVVVEVS